MRYSMGVGCAWVLVAISMAGCSNDGESAQTAWCPVANPPTGLSWDLQAASFPESLTGTVVGGIYRTADGGWTWTSQEAPSQVENFQDVAFADVNTGTIVGPGGTILKTTDGGDTWTEQDSGTEAALHGVSFFDSDQGMAVGAEGTILRTSDGGLTWVAQDSGTDVLLRGVWITDPSSATVVGDSGTILRTTDGGENWMAQESGTELDLHAVSFASSTTGVAVGAGVTMLRTTDGGATWAVQDVATRAPLYDVWFADESVGTAVGAGATILRTTDAGATWSPEETDAYYFYWETGMEPVQLGATFHGVSMADADHGVAVGEFGHVVRRMSVQDNFGVCDAFCAKYDECYPKEIAPCDISCRCELRYSNVIDPDCESADADLLRCVSRLTCEQIDALFDPDTEAPCAAEIDQVNATCG